MRYLQKLLREELLAKLHLQLFDLVTELEVGGNVSLFIFLLMFFCSNIAESFQLLLHLLDLVIELHGGLVTDLQLFDLVLKMVDLHVQLLNLLSELNDGGKGSGSRGRGKGSGSRGRCGDGGTVLERVDLLLQCFDLVLELLLETGGDGGGRVELPD